MLIQLIDEYTYSMIAEMGELYNADRIVDYCQWFKRRKLQAIYRNSAVASASYSCGVTAGGDFYTDGMSEV